MTIGIDVSPLFFDMTKASASQDLIIKKMVYLYLTNYAKQKQESAIMVMNTFHRDWNNTNYKIRGLALRALTSLQFPESLQNVTQAIS